ncbi:MAG: hypothetical protein AAF907_06190, partial [Planctomycetota bacterium]
NEKARKRTMREGLWALRQSTGADFGYDAAAWRDYLIEHGDENGYTHPYSFRSVDLAAVAALADPVVIETLEQLSMSTPSPLQRRAGL